ncbi:NAD(P)-dependent dehydrogenase (short-subunit alcohol dehydrogenase family) [Paenibacillus taihuensis]|uniref:NAD(P)-dependent dehydrogenase (Short-subunit alcohol dehydrogenase family) n=1 Tax=Paenibacillus taihuensis TaxID=1156355 RepID=A0A3D9SL48_9BACL|nr:SDR family oxidoreductase [Paenibacillus taihuensis]REE91650.1 NAD(P)-dependent dehydrogenase (short-subunit alcohol dehydrogenase family) [Paenibacillus taihuensis]
MGKFEGKVAVVTGGTSGIGLATAQRFVEEGAHVFITGRRQSELDAAVKWIGKRVTGIQGDISNLGDLDKLFDAVKQEKGHLDFLFANAGLGSILPLGHITEEQYRLTFAVNVKGTLFTVQKALPLFPNGTGSIILTGSTAGTIGDAGFSVYGGSKAALRQMARNWIMDLKGTGIRLNVLSPGMVHTPAYDDLFGEALDQVLASAKDNVPMGRVGKTDEIASAVMFLASEESSYVNGIELFVDGGMAQI